MTRPWSRSGSDGPPPWCNDGWGCGGQGGGCSCAAKKREEQEIERKEWNKRVYKEVLDKHVEAALEWEYDGHQ